MNRFSTQYQPTNPFQVQSDVYRYGFNGQEKSDDMFVSNLSFFARSYNSLVGMWLSIDPKSKSGPSFSPFNFCINNPILNLDPDGEWPWPVWARSFISASSVAGGTFRGDGRGPSTVTDKTVTSRVWLTFTVDSNAKTTTNNAIGSDPTVFYGAIIPTIPPTYIPPKIETPEPHGTLEYSTSKSSLGSFMAEAKFHYWAKDPVTPSAATPNLDVHGYLSITESLQTNTLFVDGYFDGDLFPSTEAFIVDQSGQKLFLGVHKEEGGVGDLFGDNRIPLFEISMQILFDDSGNFLGVYDETNDTVQSVEGWNEQIINTEWK